MTRPEWIEVGRVSRPHGVRGEVRVTLATDNPERFSRGSVFEARPGRSGIAISGKAARRQLTVDTARGDEDFPIVRFVEVGSREEAEAIRGYVLEIPIEDIGVLGEDEYYPFELEGLVVRGPRGDVVGTVTQVVDSPAHALLVVKTSSGAESLIPFVQSAVPEVSIEKGHVVVSGDYLKAEGSVGEAASADKEGTS